MSALVSISTAIVSVLTGVQQSGHAAFATIAEYPTIEFETGMPGVTVAPSDTASAYSTNVQNLRSYHFDVDMYLPLQQLGPAVAFTQMRTLIDSCMDAFDNSDTLGSAGGTLMLRPAPSTWGLVQSTMGELLTARIHLEAVVSVTTNNG